MITEINTQTGQIIERERTTEELTQMENVEQVPQVPFEITARQIRMSLIMLGVDLQNITDALEQLPEPQKSLAKV